MSALESGGTTERPVRLWKKRLLVLSVSLLLALLATEGLLRLVWTPPKLRSTVAFGPHPWYRVAPLPGVRGVNWASEYHYSFTHNLQGMRGDREFGLPPPGIRQRVLFVGDSFTYGVGVDNDQLFVARLQAALPDVEIANAACPATGTRGELAVLDHLGPAFKPDLVVLVFFWNDLSDNLTFNVPDFRFDAHGRVERADRVTTPDDPLAIRPACSSELPSRWTTFYLSALVGESTRALRYRYLGKKPAYAYTPERLQQAWVVTERLLRLTAARAGELHADLLLVSIPDHNQVDPAAKIKNIDPLQFDVQDKLRAVCADLKIPMADLLPEMRRAWEAGHAHYYYYVDKHLTPEGHELVARLLLPVLTEQLHRQGDPAAGPGAAGDHP